MITLSEYRKAQKKARDLTNEIQSISDKLNEEIQAIKWDYQDKIRALEGKRFEEISKLEKKRDIKLDALKTNREAEQETLRKTEEIFKFIHIHVEDDFLYFTPDEDLCLYIDQDEINQDVIKRRLKGEKSRVSPLKETLQSYWMDSSILNQLEKEGFLKVYPNDKTSNTHDKTVELIPLKMLIDNDYSKVGIFIGGSKKPVNKFRLSLKYKTVFREFYDFSFSQEILKDAPSIKTLKTWYEKNEQKLITQFIDPLRDLERQYEEALKLFKEPEWRMAYLLYQKFYYEERYSQGTETRYYKKILEEIEHMKAEGIQVC